MQNKEEKRRDYKVKNESFEVEYYKIKRFRQRKKSSKANLRKLIKYN